MSSSDSHDDDSADFSPPLSHGAVTPRGGFMARPGLKVAPRHAVVVRVGDAPESEHIPLARPSVPPPPPSEPAPANANERTTLRAIPTPSAPPPNMESLPPSSQAPQSAGPLSDAPFVAASVRGADASAPSSRRRPSGSSWAIGLAVAAGVLLGLASVLTRAGAPGSAAQPPVPSPSMAAAEQPAGVRLETATGADATQPRALPAMAPSSEPAASASGQPRVAEPGAARPAPRPELEPRHGAAISKRNIF